MYDLKAAAAAQQYPRRLWTLVSKPGDGKSTFATQMKPDLLWIDCDLRAEEVVTMVQGNVYGLSDNPFDLTDAYRIWQLANQNIRGMRDLGTIVVDTLTAVIEPIISETMDRIDQEGGNRASGWREKARALSHLFNLGNFGTDMLWIYHIRKHLDGRGQWAFDHTISELEEARAMRNLNAQIELYQEGGVFKAKVIWSRFGKFPVTVEDKAGMWAGMPLLLEKAMYGEQVGDYTDWAVGDAPATFPNPASAWAWAMTQSAGFREEAHAKNAYAKVKQENSPQTAAEMRDLWVAEVAKRREGESIPEAPPEETTQAEAELGDPNELDPVEVFHDANTVGEDIPHFGEHSPANQPEEPPPPPDTPPQADEDTRLQF